MLNYIHCEIITTISLGNIHHNIPLQKERKKGRKKKERKRKEERNVFSGVKDV